MTLNDTPQGERIHIALFGRRNVGKSRLINALTNQEVAIVSEIKGTTTDPVGKAMELLPLGPVMIIDTPGIDDEGTLGALRVRRTRDVLNKTDLALLVLEAQSGFGACEAEILALVRERNIPVLTLFNKCDCMPVSDTLLKQTAQDTGTPVLAVSAATREGMEALKLALAHCMPEPVGEPRLVADLLQPNDLVVLVTPIDSAAPKGRLILPQQQTIRDILDAKAMALVTQADSLGQTLASLACPPRMVITDSQVFEQVAAITPRAIPLTSFSILFARYKGDLHELARGAHAVATLRDNDRVVIAEGCTHHRQCDDIGTVKIPRWLQKHTGKTLRFEYVSGMHYPRDLAQAALIIHCGGCMLNRREMHYRITQTRNAHVPIVNYGVLIATLKGILPRCLEPFALDAADPASAQQAESPAVDRP